MFARLIKSLEQNEALGFPWEVIALIDHDDETIPEYKANLSGERTSVRYFYCGKHPTISKKFNTFAPLLSSEIIGICDDDVVCETPGWNRMTEETKHKDGLWMASTAGAGEAFFFGDGLYKFFGFITPPQIGHYWAITWIKDVFGSLGGQEIPAKFIEYPEENDATHQWLLRDGHRHIGADGDEYSKGAAMREFQKTKLQKLKKSIPK